MIMLLPDALPLPRIESASALETIRAQWMADVAVTLSARMTVGERLARLNEAFDAAYAAGVVEGIERCIRGRQETAPGLQRQAL